MVTAKAILKMWFSRKEWLRVRKLTKGLLSSFCITADEKKKNKAYIRAQSCWNTAPSRLPKPKSSSRRVIFCARPNRNPVSVCFCNDRLILATAWSEFLRTHARENHSRPAGFWNPAGRPAGRREAVVCNLFIAVVSASRVRWLILAPLPNHLPIHRPVCRC